MLRVVYNIAADHWFFPTLVGHSIRKNKSHHVNYSKKINDQQYWTNCPIKLNMIECLVLYPSDISINSRDSVANLKLYTSQVRKQLKNEFMNLLSVGTKRISSEVSTRHKSPFCFSPMGS